MKSLYILPFLLILVVPLAFADDAEEWCKDQPGVKDDRTMKECKKGYDYQVNKAKDDDDLKRRLASTVYEGSPDPQTSTSESTQTTRDLAVENRDLKNRITELQNTNALLESQIEDLKSQLQNAQAIIMTQLKVIMDTLANFKTQ